MSPRQLAANQLGRWEQERARVLEPWDERNEMMFRRGPDQSSDHLCVKAAGCLRGNAGRGRITMHASRYRWWSLTAYRQPFSTNVEVSFLGNKHDTQPRVVYCLQRQVANGEAYFIVSHFWSRDFHLPLSIQQGRSDSNRIPQ